MAYTQHTYVFCEEDENGVAHVFEMVYGEGRLLLLGGTAASAAAAV